MKQDAHILIVDDEEDILLSMKMLLEQHFRRVSTEPNPFLLPRLLRKEDYDLILLDMNFRRGDTSGREGMQWLQKILELKPGATVIMITAYADVKTAVEAVKTGAVDFVEKPWRNEKLLATILAALKLGRSEKKVEKLQQRQEVLSETLDQPFGPIIGNSEPMQRVFAIMDKVARTDANVLILGENGTGKELIARAIHRRSRRHREVFLAVDLGAIPDNLFESELFGHVKGAFTDARSDRAGRFQAASGGTLFLDEIGNLALPLQAKLLTALQNRVVRRVGANEAIPVDIRLICATNQPLYDRVAEKTFRQDLLYRINTVEIQLPPLRERRADIPQLVEHFRDLFGRKYHKPHLRVGPETLQKLAAYPWPGNIRELRHAVERAIILADGEQLELPDFILQGGRGPEKQEATLDSYNLQAIERWAIRRAMTKHHGNISRAAEELGLTRAALYRRLAKYDL